MCKQDMVSTACRSLLEFVLTAQYTVLLLLGKNGEIQNEKKKENLLCLHSFRCLLMPVFVLSSTMICLLAQGEMNGDHYIAVCLRVNDK